MRILKVNEMTAVSGGFGGTPRPRPKADDTTGDCPPGTSRASWTWERGTNASMDGKAGNRIVSGGGSVSGSSASKGSFDGCLTKEEIAEAAKRSLPPAK